MNATNVFKNKVIEIKDEYPLLENYGDLWAIGMYDTICEEQILNEFVSQTIPSYKTIKELYRRFPASNILVDIESPKSFTIKMYKPDFKYWSEIYKFFDAFGWYPSYAVLMSIEDSWEGIKLKGKYNNEFMDKIINLAEDDDSIQMSMEAKYDTEQQPEKYYYHLVPDIFLDKVKLKGLTPKTKSKLSTHPERIYLLNPGNELEYGTIANMLYDRTSSEKAKEKIENYYLLKIDVDAIKDKTKFYNDPNFRLGNGAVWTYQNIAPKYIEIIDTIPIYK
jgi:hypothetical protein